MTEQFSDFDAAAREYSSAPHRFRLGGEMFEVPPISSLTFARHLRRMWSDSGDPDTLAEEFFRNVLGEDQAERLLAVFDRLRYRAKEISDLLHVLMEVHTGRPTERRPDSSPSPSPTTQHSNAASSKVVSLTPASPEAPSFT